MAESGSALSTSTAPGSQLGAAIGRLARRWLPDNAQRWRLDPGRRTAVVLAAVVLTAAVAAGFAVWRARPVPEPVPSLAAAIDTGAPTDTDLVVSIAGQVVHPGLVRLQSGARVADALQAAGGPAPGTDLTTVNLARKLTDGEHVVIGLAAPQPGPRGADVVSAGSGGRVDLNTASLSDLDSLPGVGPVTAKRILDWRTEHGRFASVDQLREIDGIGEARFSQLRDLVTA